MEFCGSGTVKHPPSMISCVWVPRAEIGVDEEPVLGD